MQCAPESTNHMACRSKRGIALLATALVFFAAGITPAWAADPGPVQPLLPNPVPTSTTTVPTSTTIVPTSTTIGGAQLDLPGQQVNLGPGANPWPEILAESWVLADAITGEILASKNAHLPRPPASTLKTLTAFTLLPQLNLDSVYTVTPADANAVGSRVGLIPGKSYTIRDLFYGLFLPSGNDAAEALARANGSVSATVRQMNGVADRIQAGDTIAKNTSGFDAPGQVSSAYDLALVARAGLPLFLPFTTTKSYDFPGRKKRTFTIYNQNRLLTGGFKGAIGVKMGFTTNAGRTFVGAAERNGRTLIVTLMGIHESSAGAARKALKWGFHNQRKVTAVGVLVNPLTEEEWASTHRNSATAPGPAIAASPPPAISTAGPSIGIHIPPLSWWAWLLIVLVVAGFTAASLATRMRRKQPRMRGKKSRLRAHQPARRQFADIG